MKKLMVNLEEISSFMEIQDRSVQDYYLDKETGNVEVISGDVFDGEKDVEDLPDWEKEEVKVAGEILYNNPDRYVRIPERTSHEGYNLMVEFARGIEDESLREKLAIALRGRGAFRRLKDVLYDYPEIQKEWYDFKQERLNEEVREWLDSIGIEPI